MESYEASIAVFTRVQSIDPENASKIMGYILIHHDEQDLIRFAYGPETLIFSIVNRAKTDLGLVSNTPLVIARIPNNGFNPSSPSSPSIWSNRHSLSPNANPSPSYAAVLNGYFPSSSIESSSQVSSNREDSLANSSNNVDCFDQTVELAVSSGCMSDSMAHPFFSRRNCSFNEGYFGTEDSISGFGLKPCLYFAKGFCKNGSACKFAHYYGGLSDSGDSSVSNGDALDQCSLEIFRSRIAQQQMLASHLMGTGMKFNFPFNKLNFLQSEAQRSAAAFLMKEEFHKMNRLRMARNELLRGDSNPNARRIYLTFPADSTFQEQDVAEYFSRFGPVQDVRIPYQEKRMFGFVTLVYPKTVNVILAKGNPHFICYSRVLVKPYKDKGKLLDKKPQLLLERGESSCYSPSGVDFSEPFEFPLGGRMLINTEEMLMRQKFEDQILDLQSRRLMNLLLLNMNDPQQQHDHNASSSNEMNPDALEENEVTPVEVFNHQLDDGLNDALYDGNHNVENEDDSENEEWELLERVLPGMENVD